MRIDANMKGTIRGCKLRYHEDNNTVTATVAVRVRVTEPKARGVLGEEFHRLAFGSMIKGTTEQGEVVAKHGYRDINPQLPCEAHILKLAKQKPAQVTPEIVCITPDKNTDAVFVDMRFPLFASEELLLAVYAAFGRDVDVHLKASQGELPGVGDMPPMVIKKATGKFGNDQVVAG